METRVVQFFLNALSLGGMYALTTLGLMIVLGIARILNFAYGALIMVAGYTVLVLTSAGVPFWVAVIGAVLLTTCMALLMERVAFRPVRGADETTLLITSFAIGYFLENLPVVFINPRPSPVPLPDIFAQNFILGGLRIPKLNLFSIGVTVVVLGILLLFLKRSILGIALRAAAEDFTTTRLMGIRANAVIATAFAIEGLLGGVAMLLWLGRAASVYPSMGLTPVLIGFMAGTLGGMHSLLGSVLGGFLVGFIFTGLATVLPSGAQPFRTAILFGIVVLVLLFRPQGLIPGSYEEEMV
jgi:branched-chain amino acid transport system permease protein